MTQGNSGIRIVRMDDIPWTDSGARKVAQQELRYDTASGHYFGAAKFMPLARSGIHRHVGPAVSYMIYGALFDHDSEVREGQAYINFSGAVHNVVTYQDSLAITRLDGPVLYPTDEGIYFRLREAADRSEGIDDTVGRKPNMYITVNDLPDAPTGFAGVTRRMIYDYAGDPWNARFIQLTLAPGSSIPTHRVTNRIDGFVLAGELTIAGETATSASYVTLEPGTETEIASQYGCRFLVWADGPAAWSDGQDRPDIYGF
jgi:alkylated DNA nucleotide flippase Atl1